MGKEYQYKDLRSLIDSKIPHFPRKSFVVLFIFVVAAQDPQWNSGVRQGRASS